MSLLANQDGLDALAPHVNWHASLLHAVFPIPNTLFRLYKAFPEYPMVRFTLQLPPLVQCCLSHVILCLRPLCSCLPNNHITFLSPLTR